MIEIESSLMKMEDAHRECPFDAGLKKYWDRLTPKEQCMQLDEQALYSLSLAGPALKVAMMTSGSHVLDAFCGAGGNAIALARAGKQVTAIELDRTRLDMAKYNASLFEVADKIDFLNGDAIDLLGSIQCDTIYFDPPWGGPSYSQQALFKLDGFAPDGDQLLTIALRLGREVVMKLPKNFDFNELKKFDRSYRIHRDVHQGHLLCYTMFMAAED